MKNFLYALIALLFIACSGGDQGSNGNEEDKEEVSESKEVNLYSHRHYDIDAQIYKRFEEETGIKVNVIKAKADELLEKIKTEGENSPADILVTVDAGRLHRAVESGVLSPMDPSIFPSALNKQYIDANNLWVALTLRARLIAYSKERVDPSSLSTMEDLADPKWKGKILVRSSSNLYNQSLMASIIAHDGTEKASSWAENVVANFAREPKGNDRDQVKAIYAGEGDIAIVNSYYIGKLLSSTEEAEVKAGESVGVFFPNQERGTHVNISGAGICKHAPNRKNAEALIKFLLSEDIQGMYSEGNHEYPVIESAQLDPILAEWGSFNKDSLSFGTLGKLNTEAVKVFDRAGWK